MKHLYILKVNETPQKKEEEEFNQMGECEWERKRNSSVTSFNEHNAKGVSSQMRYDCNLKKDRWCCCLMR